MNNIKYTNIVFTLNNYTDLEYNDLLSNDLIEYIIIGKEVGSEGTPHLQGYAELINRSRFTKVKSINNRMHFEPRKGTQKQAIAYCKKDGDWVDRGTPKSQGHRTDLDKLKGDLINGRSMRDIVVNESLNYTQLCFLQKTQPYLLKNKLSKGKQVIWCYGPTGTGKSKFAWDYLDDKDEIYYKNPSNKWWDGYDSHKLIIIDDLRANNFLFTDLLRMFDIYPYRLEFKGGSTFLNSDTIIVTTNKHPREMFANQSDEDIQQMLRRITIKEFCAPGQEVGGQEVVGNTATSCTIENLANLVI